MPATNILALDVGEKRIGMATGDTAMKIPRILPTLSNDDNFSNQLADIVTYEGIDAIVVGYPRNLAGETTAQTEVVEQFIASLQTAVSVPIYTQDESLTSIKAEERLRERGKPYARADIDAEAAAIILQDYMDAA